MLPLLALAAAPAHAEAGEGWFGDAAPGPVDTMHVLLWFVVVPTALFLVIGFLALVPALIKREPILPRHGGDAQWIGGPGRGTKELPEAEQAASGSGGASGSW